MWMANRPELEVVLLSLPSGKLSAVWACHHSAPDKVVSWIISHHRISQNVRNPLKMSFFSGIFWAPFWRRCLRWREQPYAPPSPAGLQRPGWHQASLGRRAEIWKQTLCLPQILAIGGGSFHHSSWLEDFHSAKHKLNWGFSLGKAYICFSLMAMTKLFCAMSPATFLD